MSSLVREQRRIPVEGEALPVKFRFESLNEKMIRTTIGANRKA